MAKPLPRTVSPRSRPSPPVSQPQPTADHVVSVAGRYADSTVLVPDVCTTATGTPGGLATGDPRFARTASGRRGRGASPSPWPAGGPPGRGARRAVGRGPGDRRLVHGVAPAERGPARRPGEHRGLGAARRPLGRSVLPGYVASFSENPAAQARP
ncbi:hypothetical protein QJS66_20900 [Kocuria rhizophila]|nr:hypothetical protein QJS66_20900 [Kocuria rhizophila]